MPINQTIINLFFYNYSYLKIIIIFLFLIYQLIINIIVALDGGKADKEIVLSLECWKALGISGAQTIKTIV